MSLKCIVISGNEQPTGRDHDYELVAGVAIYNLLATDLPILVTRGYLNRGAEYVVAQ